MKRLITILTAVLLATRFASAQNGTLNPTNPPDPAALYKMTVTAEPAEAATTSGSGNYAQGTKVTVKATAKTNYTFKYWMQNGEQIGQTSTSFKLTMPAADVTLVAVFEYVEPDYNPTNPADPQVIAPEYALFLEADPAGACSFNRTNGAKVKEGTKVSIKATPVTGYKFEGWYDSEGTLLGSSATLSYTMPSAPATLTARLSYSPSNPNDPSSTQGDVDNELALGDVNGDDQITAQDASLVLQHVAGKTVLTGALNTVADVNGDGQVTAGDASLILQKVAGKVDW